MIDEHAIDEISYYEMSIILVIFALYSICASCILSAQYYCCGSWEFGTNRPYSMYLFVLLFAKLPAFAILAYLMWKIRKATALYTTNIKPSLLFYKIMSVIMQAVLLMYLVIIIVKHLSTLHAPENLIDETSFVISIENDAINILLHWLLAGFIIAYGVMSNIGMNRRVDRYVKLVLIIAVGILLYNTLVMAIFHGNVYYLFRDIHDRIPLETKLSLFMLSLFILDFLIINCHTRINVENNNIIKLISYMPIAITISILLRALFTYCYSHDESLYYRYYELDFYRTISEFEAFSFQFIGFSIALFVIKLADGMTRSIVNAVRKYTVIESNSLKIIIQIIIYVIFITLIYYSYNGKNLFIIPQDNSVIEKELRHSLELYND